MKAHFEKWFICTRVEDKKVGRALRVASAKQKTFLDKVRRALPNGDNLNLCLTCGACAAGCPATGLRDMEQNKSNNYCCGGGGGYLQSGYNEERYAYGKLKFDQIM